SRPSVEDDERGWSVGVAGTEVARDAVPRLRLAERDGALAHLHVATLRRLSTFPPLPHPLASARATEESGAALVSATRTRRGDRPLSEPGAYAACHGHRALYPERTPASPERDERLRTALMRALEALRP